MNRFPLALVPYDWLGSAFVALFASATVAAAIGVIEWAFHGHLPRQILWYMVRTVGDELLWRLLVMSALTWVAWRNFGRVPAPLMWAIIVTTQVLNITLTTPAPTDAMMALYYALRYIAPGIVWGWLYWRHGWLTAVIGHAMTYPFLYVIAAISPA